MLQSFPELLYYEVENISCKADWSNEFKFLIGLELELVAVIGYVMNASTVTRTLWPAATKNKTASNFVDACVRMHIFALLVRSHVPQHTTLEIWEICLNFGKEALCS